MTLTLTGFTPPARYDQVAWVSARIEESATETGSFVAVETIPFDTVDVDPRNPATRSFTTELATPDYWYRIVWIATDTDESEPTEASTQIDSVEMPYATLEELAALLKITTPGDFDGALNRVLLAAAGEISSEVGPDTTLTGWKLALATEVNLERAAEHWAQLKSPFGFVGLGGAEMGTPYVSARDSWDRHAYKLAPLKSSWGIA